MGLEDVRTFAQLVNYLRDELDWPITTEDFDELTYQYDPADLGLSDDTAVQIKAIHQLRPLVTNQPWGIFFIDFEPKRLPLVVLRRILQKLVVKKRADAGRSHQAAWRLHDLLFISSYGTKEHRDLTFAHFSEEAAGTSNLPTLRVLGWDDEDTVLHVRNAARVLSDNLRWPDDDSNVNAWRQRWSGAFTLRHNEVITTAKALAIRLADLATKIRKRANAVLKVEAENGLMRKLHKAFREALIHDLEYDDFADMYAQTIAYGLLTAAISRTTPDDPSAPVVADNLVDMVPVTNPFLRDTLESFLTVGGRSRNRIDFDELGVSEVIDLLRRANMPAVLRDFGDRNPNEDAAIRFYEDFLREYDPKKRMERGVFYTPLPVVSYVVRSVHELLQTEFGLADGLADTTTWGEMLRRRKDLKLPEIDVVDPQTRKISKKPIDPVTPFVQILDPATGTATFLVEVIDVIHKTMTAKWKKEGHGALWIDQKWNEYVPKHLLPRLYGYELMMAPYAIAHMKIGLRLYETGYKFASGERARIYLTNALEPPKDSWGTFEQMAPALAHEARDVNRVKRDQPITVVVGNPPYAQYSMNLDDEAKAHIERFRYANGQKIRSRNPLQLERNLNDDYVKFLGFSTALFQPGSGVIGMITNRMFLDSESLVGLREWLATHFDQLRIIDLAGSSEEARRVERLAGDENVFDILQGVAITFAVRRRQPAGPPNPVRSTELIGTRNSKYESLSDRPELPGASWRCVVPRASEWRLHTDAGAGSRGDHELPLDKVFRLLC